MATTPDLHEPQIAAARAQAWRQTGDSLLTLEAMRAWIEPFGLVLFAPVAATLGFPAPSLVEATLGTPKANATLAEMGTARSLAARMVGEGSALPLNLLGGPGDLPDFLVTAAAFPFVFTLRGDKGWKRPPETSGTVKVTPLALRVYELLAEKGALPIAEIVPEVGREVTDSAIARALSELWQLLRVIPVLQQGEGATLWELTTSRFLKAVKAGANAGQPTALSGLVSLYLSQALVATEEEIAGFLSPLTARSRIREVLHGLSAARQLSEGVVQGKTVVYIPEMLPDFAAFAPAGTEGLSDVEQEKGDGAMPEGSEPAEPTEKRPASDRIRRFGEGGGPGVGKDRPLRGKPVRREGAGAAGAERPRREASSRGPRDTRGRTGEGQDRRPFAPRGPRPAPREGAGSGSERRPRPAGARPSYSKPWNEERGNRPPREGGGAESSFASRGPRPPRRDAGGEGDRPRRTFGSGAAARPPRREGGAPPFRRRDEAAGGTENRGETRRPYVAREDRPGKPFRDRPASGDRPPRTFRDAPGGSGGFERPERPKRDRPDGEGRPFAPREGGDRPFRPRPDSREAGARERRPPAGGGARFGGGDRPRSFSPGGAGGRATGGAPRNEGPRAPRSGPAGEARPFRGDRSTGPAGPRSNFRPGPGSGARGGAGARPGFGPRTGAGPRGGGSASGPRFGGGSGAGGARPGAGARPPFKRAGGKPASGAPRAPRKPRPEDEA